MKYLCLFGPNLGIGSEDVVCVQLSRVSRIEAQFCQQEVYIMETDGGEDDTMEVGARKVDIMEADGQVDIMEVDVGQVDIMD